MAVLCPTTPLTRQWAAAGAALGVQLEPDAAGARPPRDFDGVAVTYARIASDPRAWAAEVTRETLVVVDEAHHLGEELAWGTAFQRAFAAAPRWLLLSGTPFRSDATPIPGVGYDADGLAVPDVSYTYAEAVADGICRPVAFVTFDGSLSWRSGEDVIESSFETVLTAREASRRYRTAISTELPDGLPRILREADAKLRALRAEGQRDAGGLVVAADATHARRIAKLLGEATGQGAGGGAAHRGARGAQAGRLPRLARAVDRRRQHGLRGRRHPAAARRRVRDGGQDAADLPADRGALRAHDPGPPAGAELDVPAGRPGAAPARAEVETELRHVLREREPGEGLDELRERRASEPAAALDFVPLSAEFAPQMTLFGAAPGAAAAVQGSVAAAAGSTAAPAATPAAVGQRPPRPTRPRRGRPSSAAKACARSAAAWSPTCSAAAGAATARSTRGSTARSGCSAWRARRSSSWSARSKRSSRS